ncbi:hypothetical protein ACQSSU_03095 [Micromonospora echinospora]
MNRQETGDEWPPVTVAAPAEHPAEPEQGDVDRVRTRWKLDRQRHRRHVSGALDDLCVRLYGADEAARYGIRDRRRRAA